MFFSLLYKHISKKQLQLSKRNFVGAAAVHSRHLRQIALVTLVTPRWPICFCCSFGSAYVSVVVGRTLTCSSQ